MRKNFWACLWIASLMLPALPALADSYSDTVALFKNAGASGHFSNPATAMPSFRRLARAGSSSAELTAQAASIRKTSTSAIAR